MQIGDGPAAVIPLFLSANILDHPEILRRFSDKIIINAVTADPNTIAHSMESANRFGSALVVLLVKPGLTPSGLDDRLQLAADVLEQAEETDNPDLKVHRAA